MDKLRQCIASSRTGLMNLRKIVDLRVKFASSWMKNLKIKFPECKSYRGGCVVRHLVNMHFNVGAKNATILLNRRKNTKKIALKIVKALKKKVKHADLSNEKRR